jgi:hypothetical protein
MYEIPPGGTPVRLSTLAFSVEIRSLAFFNDLLFASCGPFGLAVVDVQDASDPRTISVFRKGRVESVVFDETGKAAYACTGTSALLVLDVTNPEELKLKKALTVPNATTYEAVRKGNTILVAAGSAGIAAFSCERKFHPVLVSKAKDLASTTGLAVKDRIVAAFDSEKGIVFVEYPTWDNPKVRGAVSAGLGALAGSVASDGLLLTAEGVDGVRLVDFSNPLNPQTVAQLSTAAPAYSVLPESVSSSLLCAGEGGLSRLDFQTASSPTITPLLPGGGGHGPVATLGSTVYIVRNSLLETWDYSDPLTPALLSQVGFAGRAIEACVFEGQFLALSCQNAGVTVYDLTEPGNPTLLCSISTERSALQAAILGDRLVVAEGSLGIEVFDFTSPGNPLKIAEWNQEKEAMVTGVVFADSGELWIGHSVLGIALLDISDASNIEVLSKNTDSGEKTGPIVLNGTRLFQCTRQAGVNIFDISDPLNPEFDSILPTYSAMHASFLEDGSVVVADGFNGVRIFDLDTEEKPVQSSFLGVPGYCPAAVSLSGGFILAVSNTSGVLLARGTSCQGSLLSLPCDGYAFTKFFPPMFSWSPSTESKYILKISLSPAFDKKKETFVLGSSDNPIRIPYVDIGLTGLDWILRNGGSSTLYWKIVYLQSGSKIDSEVRTFTF